MGFEHWEVGFLKKKWVGKWDWYPPLQDPLKFMFSLFKTYPGQHELLSLNYDCNICRRVSELRRKIYAKYLRALTCLSVNSLNGLLTALSFRQAERNLIYIYLAKGVSKQSNAVMSNE